jgi:hypothetical protein
MVTVPLKVHCVLCGGSMARAVPVPIERVEEFGRLSDAEKDRYFAQVGQYLAVDADRRLPLCGTCLGHVARHPELAIPPGIRYVERRRYFSRRDTAFSLGVPGGARGREASARAAAIAYAWQLVHPGLCWERWVWRPERPACSVARLYRPVPAEGAAAPEVERISLLQGVTPCV